MSQLILVEMRDTLAPRRDFAVDAARFAKLTGWQGRTSEHARDAAMLVYGMTRYA